MPDLSNVCQRSQLSNCSLDGPTGGSRISWITPPVNGMLTVLGILQMPLDRLRWGPWAGQVYVVLSCHRDLGQVSTLLQRGSVIRFIVGSQRIT